MKRFRLAMMSGAAMTLLTLAPSPSWAQKSDALEEEARGAQERLRAIRYWERQLREAEEARLKGDCAKVASYHLSFQKNLVEEPWSTEIVANLRRRMEEIALRDCPPGSGRPSITLPPEPASGPVPRTSAVLPDAPAPVGSAGTPAPQAAPQDQPLEDHEDILDEIAGDPDPTAPDASAPSAPRTDPSDPSSLRGRMSAARTMCDRERFEELKRQLIASLDRRIVEATDEFTRGRLMRERELAEAAVMPEPCPPVEPALAPRTAPPPPPRQPEQVHVPPRPLAEPQAPVGSVGTPVPESRRTAPPRPPRQPEEVHVPPRPTGAAPSGDILDGLGSQQAVLDWAISNCDRAAFQAAKNRLLEAIGQLLTRFPENIHILAERRRIEETQFPRPCPPDEGLQQGSVEWRFLNEHNKERALYRLPPLQWDPQLAAGAMTYAQQLARTGVRVHAPREAPREGRGAVRENLNQGMLGWSPSQMLQNWLRERQDFVPGEYPDVTRTGRWQDVSHYTQMIWPTTTQIGCGLASGSGYQWLVCRYSPGGNKDGMTVGLNPPVIANQGDIAPPNSSTPTIPRLDPRDMPRVGGGMTQIDPPPPPPPTARDDAPEGNEANHPLVRYAQAADAQHATETDCGNAPMARLELEKMRYALDELKKRLKAARQAGPFSSIKPADVQRQIDDLERRIREAEQRKSRGACPLPPAPQQRGVVSEPVR